MKTLFACTLILACVFGLSACETDEPIVQTTTTTEETIVQRPAAASATTTETRTIRSY